MNALAALIGLVFLVLSSFGFAQDRVLFIRGADRSGGFLEAGNDFQRTEQLADIFNASTANGNHGWAELRITLEEAGFDVEQIAEPVEAGNDSGPTEGRPVAFDQIDLLTYDVLVLGSNNAVYGAAAVDAVEGFVRSGGGLLVISDANFGGDWSDAPSSDQQFLDRFGLIMNQDQGTYALMRSDGDFSEPDHPILEDVDAFDGEGVSPIVSMIAGQVLVGAKNSTRVNTPPFGNNNQGQSRPVTIADGALTLLKVDEGRVAGHFDRNTFFNLNGAGTNINRLDNRRYALNLFRWLVGHDDQIHGDRFEAD
ncbi:MAG: hypothetical protein AAGJ52_07415 [Pseudomonadota bacterium]